MMAADDPDEGLLDKARLADLLDLLPADPELEADLLALFQSSTEEDFGRLRTAVETADGELMERALHRMAGTAASAGCDAFTRRARAAHDEVVERRLITPEELEMLQSLRDRSFAALKTALAG